MAFPLNVYARVLELEEGQAEYLHYGLHTCEDMPFLVAQRRSTILLEGLLPPVDGPTGPCQVLEVGIGLGTTLARLEKYGYRTTGITPDAGQIALARARHGDAFPVTCARLEDFCEKAGGWDLLLLQESAQYIDPLQLFRQADLLLSEQGEILLADEFIYRRERGQGAVWRENLHHIDQFLSVAERFGFGLDERLDVGAEAAPSLDWILRVIDKHRAALTREFDLDHEMLDALNRSNRAYREQYAAGIIGYALLKLRRRQP